MYWKVTEASYTCREAQTAINAGRIYNLNDLIQLHKCTQNIKLDSMRWFSYGRRPVYIFTDAQCNYVTHGHDHIVLFYFCATIQQNDTFGAWGTRSGAYDLQIRTRARFLYSAPRFIVLCLIVRKLSCWETDKPTDAAENILLASICYTLVGKNQTNKKQ